ncbi:hypothetical protein H0H87_003649 [Tephrocybe sp. NHM501043]|nr:hypothetical protein H0H87_003649 [Tephrocybe sp. NHM501043]
MIGDASSSSYYQDSSTSRAPIYRLPYEILLEIFSTELQDRYSGDRLFQRRLPRRSLTLGKKLDPILLGQVCKQWRDTTLSSPLLWSSLSVLCNLKPQTAELLAIWLERSGEQPLTINFIESLCDLKTDDEWFNPPLNPVTDKVMSLLTAHAHRWKTIDFEFSLQISPLLANMSAKSFKILESAKLRSRRATNVRFDGLPPLVKVWDAFHGSPSFHSADYEMEYVNHKLRDIPWSRLTSVDLTISMEDLFEVLPLCENLVELHYTDPLARYAARALPQKNGLPKPLSHVVLPALRRLSMVSTLSPDEAFQNLTLPLLHSVQFRQNNVWIAQPDPFSFTNFLTRSGCQLKKYSYEALGNPVGEEILCEILASPSMSYLVELSVEGATEKFAEMMTKGSTILPELETLTLVRCSMMPGELGQMVSSLRRGHEQFLFFNAEYWNRHEADRKIFTQLRDEGMVIKD